MGIIDSDNPAYAQPQGGTFNGGGGFGNPEWDRNNGKGSGATDIRLQDGAWNNFGSLKSRIMVAAGSGACISGSPSYAGALSSESYTDTYPGSYSNAAKGASQTSGYMFGTGQSGDRAGAGGGYYGGYATVNVDGGRGLRGAGGSSFISGHSGCNAISSSSTSSNIIHTGQPNHYSGNVFTNTVMKAGNETMPSPTGGTETGHRGNGYCKITWHPAL